MSEVKIFSNCYSQEEIKNYMISDPNIENNNLLGWWPLDHMYSMIVDGKNFNAKFVYNKNIILTYENDLIVILVMLN